MKKKDFFDSLLSSLKSHPTKVGKIRSVIIIRNFISGIWLYRPVVSRRVVEIKSEIV